MRWRIFLRSAINIVSILTRPTNMMTDTTTLLKSDKSAGKLLSDYRYDWFQRSKVAAYYFADNERLPQYETERVLRDRLNELDPDALKLGCKFTRLDAGEDQVEVTFTADDGTEGQLVAPYVVGCDGARSAVREQAGIAQAVDHQGPRMALLVFRSDGLDELLVDYTGKSIFNIMNPDLDGYWQFLGRFDLNGGWFYHFPVPTDATAENYDSMALPIRTSTNRST